MITELVLTKRYDVTMTRALDCEPCDAALADIGDAEREPGVVTQFESSRPSSP